MRWTLSNANRESLLLVDWLVGDAFSQSVVRWSVDWPPRKLESFTLWGYFIYCFCLYYMDVPYQNRNCLKDKTDEFCSLPEAQPLPSSSSSQRITWTEAATEAGTESSTIIIRRRRRKGRHASFSCVDCRRLSKAMSHTAMANTSGFLSSQRMIRSPFR